jgi:hypothetical protein
VRLLDFEELKRIAQFEPGAGPTPKALIARR